MSATRLTFLYPHLFRTTVRATETSAARRTCGRRAAEASRSRGYAAFAPTSEARQSGFAPRHGKGIEPVTIESQKTGGAAAAPAPAPAAGKQEVPPAAAAAAAAAVAAAASPNTSSAGTASKGSGKPAANNANNANNATTNTESSENTTGTTGTTAAQAQPAEEASGEAKAAKKEARDQAKKSGPLEAILHMGPPEEVAKQHPHMSPPPYVHHFDSYSLVKQLGGGGYTEEQAITAMKAIRALLAHNLDVAQESLVSKSDVENETYLFRAACSELGTEVKNNQKLGDEEMRQKRTLLQHEIDILTQSLNQELVTLNDNVRGMFNDRKMAVREEQKAVDSKIQQISYKISLQLSSDAKSEIETLRWILIRRSAVGILFMAVATLLTLRYGTYVSHENQKEAERIRKQAELIKKADGKTDHSSAPDAAEILAAN
ncbi:MOZ protein represents a chromatin-associated acetyltransferase [Colletotrichum sojae]|uniref:MOZ protein represents a chromatin-associated acetyltransferase n=1 Tax=Colletotrichum sojae TaxID=2175907 RepID=A0A8H6MKG1_9PEZI|nr:MOZ protein represents a chromatin-associated acetyltransferase [Colletotrichum sojae]